MKGLKQYYFKIGKSVYISKYLIIKKNSIPKLQFLKIRLNVKNMAQKLPTFWLLFYISGSRPQIFQKKHRGSFNVTVLNVNLRKNTMFSFFEKVLAIYLPNTLLNNLTFLLKGNILFNFIKECSSYIEVDNIFRDLSVISISVYLQFVYSMPIKNKFIARFLQMPI
jgi:ribosomal protein L5